MLLFLKFNNEITIFLLQILWSFSWILICHILCHFILRSKSYLNFLYEICVLHAATIGGITTVPLTNQKLTSLKWPFNVRTFHIVNYHLPSTQINYIFSHTRWLCPRNGLLNLIVCVVGIITCILNVRECVSATLHIFCADAAAISASVALTTH